MSFSPHQRQDSTQGGYDVIKATRCGWTHNGLPVKDGIINVPAGITNVLLFETAPDLVDPRIHLETQRAPSGPSINLFVPLDVPIPDILPKGQYSLSCQYRDPQNGDLNGTLNVGTGSEEHRGDTVVSV